MQILPHASGRLMVELSDTAGLEAASAEARPAGPRAVDERGSFLEISHFGRKNAPNRAAKGFL